MEIAGRVAIVPGGDYIRGKEYKRLDTVRYEGGVYLAKKNNVNEDPVVGEDTDFWMFMVESVKVTIANTEEVGIVKPDGKTITIDEDGTITGASAGFVGSTEEAGAAMEAGEFSDGQLVFIDDDFTPGGGGGSGIIGNTDISSIADGTLTGAVDELNNGLLKVKVVTIRTEIPEDTPTKVAVDFGIEQSRIKTYGIQGIQAISSTTGVIFCNMYDASTAQVRSLIAQTVYIYAFCLYV